MRKAFIAPLKYIQCEDALKHLGEYIKVYGDTALLVASKQDFERVKKQLDETCKMYGVKLSTTDFQGECSYDEIRRIQNIAVETNAAVHIGLGGGKALDAAKCIGKGTVPIIICPTIASTDAPTSHVSVIYTPEGEVAGIEFIRQNPDVVLVDTKVIANAPARFLVAGMGDALATYFEARSCQTSGAGVLAGGFGKPKAAATIAGNVLSHACYLTLLKDGLAAKKACENKIINQALENTIEANILLSGLGFESGGLAAAHAIHDALTVLPETHGRWHGEKVAFGVLTHLVLEKAKADEIAQVINFCISVGLPVTLEELGLKNITDAQLKKVAASAVNPDSFIHNMPFKVTATSVEQAIMEADKLGRAALKKIKSTSRI